MAPVSNRQLVALPSMVAGKVMNSAVTLGTVMLCTFPLVGSGNFAVVEVVLAEVGVEVATCGFLDSADELVIALL